jgi:hypothetical protein
LDQRQRDLLARLGLPTALTTTMDDDKWFAITDRLGEEIQARGVDMTGDGVNEYGEARRQILERTACAEDVATREEHEPLVDDTQQLPDGFGLSEPYEERLRRSRLMSRDLPRGDVPSG